MDVNVITRTEWVCRVKMTDGKRDLVLKEGRGFKHRDFGHMVKQGRVEGKTSVGNEHARTRPSRDLPWQAPFTPGSRFRFRS